MAKRPCQNLSKRQREGTPIEFAEYLVNLARGGRAGETVAALWVMRGSVYRRMGGVECWGEEEDARRYEGPWRIVAHPPCGPWGKLKWRCHQSKEHGIAAMEMVHRWGGVVEQPLGSSLFREYGREGVGSIVRVHQGRFGHLAVKETILYVVSEGSNGNAR